MTGKYHNITYWKTDYNSVKTKFILRKEGDTYAIFKYNEFIISPYLYFTNGHSEKTIESLLEQKEIRRKIKTYCKQCKDD